MATTKIATSVVLLAGLILAACGTRAPRIEEALDGIDGTKRMEFEIKRRVYCDLREAVRSVNTKNRLVLHNPVTGKDKEVPLLPEDWGAQVALALQVDESTAFNPSILVTKVKGNYVKGPNANPVAQSITMGAGATLSATATTTHRYNPYYSVEALMQPETASSPCKLENDPFLQKGQKRSTSSPLIISDLGIQKWLDDAMFTNTFLFSQNPGGAPGNVTPDTVTLEVKFVILSAGSLNPSWKLVPVTVSSSALPLFAASRTRTHSLIITIGPPKNETSQAHFAAQVSDALNSLPRF